MNKLFSDQFDWDELLDFIAEKKLTPVLGKEIYTFKDADKLAPLDNYLSQKILELHKISDFNASSLSAAVNYLEIEKKIKPMDIIRKLKSIVKDINFELPVLQQLLSITDLNYFINTAVYDSVLENKISEMRNQKANSINFSINEPFTDYPIDKLSEPFIFNVFGSLLNTVDPALSEEDMLEYTGFFKEKMSGATNIVSALKNKSLLFLGCSFPDWMVRFALRLLSNEPLHEWGAKRKIIIINDPSELRAEQNEFLKNYDVVTYEGDTAQFVNELHNQWKKRNPNAGKKKSIFLSYTRADIAAVESMKKAIEQLGNVICWYDNRELKPADNWLEEIVVNIRKADLFMPLISANSLAHEDGFVQKEWVQGTNEWIFRNADKKAGKYLVPVVIDDSKLYNDKISKYFDSNINIATVPQGNPGAEFLEDIKKILNLA
ncbi:MAG: toll/interleukin-1 receptor domain-containing protein [Bacteroidetes bacterium]|nr:MAG: toll/interleukin-1 receptor domain-containing protein [Bacteroidota bacterium]